MTDTPRLSDAEVARVFGGLRDTIMRKCDKEKRKPSPVESQMFDACGQAIRDAAEVMAVRKLRELAEKWKPYLAQRRATAPAGGRDTTPPPQAENVELKSASESVGSLNSVGPLVHSPRFDAPAADAAPRPETPPDVEAMRDELATCCLCEYEFDEPHTQSDRGRQVVCGKCWPHDAASAGWQARAAKAEAEVTALRQSLTACEDALNTAHETVDKLAADIATARAEATADVLQRVREKAIVGRWPKNDVCQCVLCGQIWVGVNPEPHEDDCPLRVPDAPATPKEEQ